MKIFLVGEGPTDCGWEDNGIWEDGPVQVYLRRLMNEVEILTVHKSQIRDMRKKKRQRRIIGKLKGHSVNAFFIAQAALDNECDCAAMYVDGDESSKDFHTCQVRYDSLKEEILAGLQIFTNIQALAIIPMKMIESWMLGDSEAFLCLYKKKLDYKYFRNPELIWGNSSDTTSDFPKNKLARALSECNAEPTRAEFSKIAAVQSIDELRRTCPISFEDFHTQVMQLQTVIGFSPEGNKFPYIRTCAKDNSV